MKTLDASRHLSNILNSRGVKHWLDLWGYDQPHDWPSRGEVCCHIFLVILNFNLFFMVIPAETCLTVERSGIEKKTDYRKKRDLQITLTVYVLSLKDIMNWKEFLKVKRNKIEIVITFLLLDPGVASTNKFSKLCRST
ncbi:MAG: hypothetical protein MZV64_69715 [Ignavibacteriales bacterium]|nr:hypothetical protein [Ignavibacteriales bacterium]